MKIEINQEQIDKIIVEELQESYRIMSNDMITISAMKKIPPHRQEDYDDQKKTRKAMKKVLSYYMVKEDFEDWVKDNGYNID